MPNWAEGTIKLRGRAENIASALKYMFCDNAVTVKEEWDVGKLIFETTAPYFYINGTRRGFIETGSLEFWLEQEFLIVELQKFKQAWAAIAENYQEISSKFDVDIKIFTFERGMQFTQEIEISKGNVVKDICNDKFSNYKRDVSFSNLGGGTMKKRLRLKKFKQVLQYDMLANVWDGSYQDKRRIMKMSHLKMIKELHEEWLNQTGYPRIMDFD